MKEKKNYVTFYNRILEKIPKSLTFKDLESYYPKLRKGRVVKVYDGDSITIAARIPKSKDRTIYKFNIRLNRIDTPEIRTRDNKEKVYGLKIRDLLSDKIMNEMVDLKVIDTDKYGRLLAEVIYNNENINNWLLQNKYAMEYNGGQKKKFSEIEYNTDLSTLLETLRMDI
jgi:endonuclease YncB( thermonuclease family)